MVEELILETLFYLSKSLSVFLISKDQPRAEINRGYKGKRQVYQLAIVEY